MKNRLPLYLAVFFCIILSACGRKDRDRSQNNNTTGYEWGIQIPCIYHNNGLYSHKDRVDLLPDSVTEIGEIISVDNENYPNEEMEASRLEVGVTVYQAGGMLYTLDKDGKYACYRRLSVEEMQSIK